MRLLIPCLAVGCATSQTVVRSTYAEDAAPIDSVVIFVSIQHEAHVGIFFRGFETRLQSRLEKCRVQMKILHGLPPSDDADAAGPNPANAWLTLVPYGGTYTRVSSNSYQDGTTKIDGAFKLQVLDHRAKKVTWRAIIDVKSDSTPDVSDGATFADTILSRLRADGVVACAG